MQWWDGGTAGRHGRFNPSCYMHALTNSQNFECRNCKLCCTRVLGGVRTRSTHRRGGTGARARRGRRGRIADEDPRLWASH